LSQDMLRIVCAAEEEARDCILTAGLKADALISSAHKQGEETVSATLERAKTEISHLIRASDQKATTDAQELASSTANKLATQRAKAEKRLDAAAELIAERILS